MVRRYSRRRRTSFRRRRSTRSYRRRSTNRVGSKYKKTSWDGVVYSKCHHVVRVQFTTGTQYAASLINWGGITTDPTYDTTYINESIEFQNMAANYEMWRLKGLKIQYIPDVQSNANGNSGVASSVGEIWMASDDDFSQVNGSTTTDALYPQKIDFKMVPGNRVIKKYIDASRYYRKKGGQMWIPRGSFYTDMFTGIKAWAQNLPDGTFLGTLHVTWYVMFKGFSLP